jgi:hypothetical protein
MFNFLWIINIFWFQVLTGKETWCRGIKLHCHDLSYTHPGFTRDHGLSIYINIISPPHPWRPPLSMHAKIKSPPVCINGKKCIQKCHNVFQHAFNMPSTCLQHAFTVANRCNRCPSCFWFKNVTGVHKNPEYPNTVSVCLSEPELFWH